MKIKMFGSAGYEFAQVASNKIQAYVLMAKNYWDILPGKFICEMAGAEMITGQIQSKKLIIACNNSIMKKYFESLIKDIDID